VDQAADAKVGTITFTGGEPMLHKNIVIELITQASSHKIDTGLNSNATYIDLETARKLSESGLNHALISLLGPENAHNAIGGGSADFVKTINGIRSLVEVGIPVATNMVVSKLNLGLVRETAHIAKDIGTRTFCAGPMIPSCYQNVPLCLSQDECIHCLRELILVGRELDMNIDVLEPLPRCLFSGENEAEFIELFGNRICSAAVTSCAISSSGMMRPCIHSDVNFGSVLPDHLLGAWNSMSSWASPDMLPDECKKCNALMICEAGCRMSSKVCTGNYNGHDMYMTKPIMDIERAKLRPNRSFTVHIRSDDLLEYNEWCIVRAESAGYIVYLNSRIEYMTPSGFQFLSTIKPLGRFSPRQLAERFSYPESELIQVLERLLSVGVLQKVKDHEKE
jgi:radical SAM protein with 4Fe4S-binding SPASM domain